MEEYDPADEWRELKSLNRRLANRNLDLDQLNVQQSARIAELEAERAKLRAIGERAVVILRAQYLTGDAREIEADLEAAKVKP